eukprot:2097276-Pyramimonas_sp.AAC.1
MVECSSCGRKLFQDRLKSKNWTCVCGCQFSDDDIVSPHPGWSRGGGQQLAQSESPAAQFRRLAALLPERVRGAAQGILQELDAPAPKPPLQPGQGLQQATARVNRARKQLDK